MSKENITLILLAVIGLVFLIDFIKNNSKKSIEKSVEEFVEKEDKKTNSSNPVDWILNRKKNITISILFIIAIKIPVHYFFEHDICEYGSSSFGAGKLYCVEFKDFFNAVFSDYLYINIQGNEFSSGVYGTIDARLDLFIPITIVFLTVVWFFNDKIKAQ